eukprot:XP_001693232.1 predicted protein [Chlamydomonas reinhardtii]
MQSTLPSCSSRNVFGAKRQARAGRVVVRAETAARDKPAWTGDSVLSRVVNWAIDTPALYGAMKVLAKNAMKNSAESRGVKWDAHVKEMEKLKELEAIKSELEDPGLQPYPDYYLKPFHAYETGNLEWLAAWEVQPATYAMGIRTFKDHPDWSAEKCFVEMRSRQTDTIKVVFNFVIHECPQHAIDSFVSEGLRIIKPNGVLCFIDNNPNSSGSNGSAQ